MDDNHNKMVAVTAVKTLDDFNIELTFDDGCTKVVDLKPFLNKPITKPLKKPDYFARVKIDSCGGIYWPNTYDICPEFLRYHI
ncbi:MAG: DUF2442 domain-containing protein [Bacteroidia bacterium]|nr:DUF2442 domain-containing protein [Bacteroidia bacterium]